MQIKFFANLRYITGKEELEVPLPEPRTLKELFEELSQTYGPKMRDYLFTNGTVSQDLMLCLNDQVISRDPDTKLKDTDELSILLPLSGGTPTV